MVNRIQVEGLCFSYGATPVLNGIDLDDLRSGQVTALLGPNAAGKTTLFKCLVGLLSGEGCIRFDGQDAIQLGREEIRRRVTYLPQASNANAVLTVFESILLARRQTTSWRVGNDDLVAVQGTLEALGIDELALRYLNELSGGQRQMVAIAQALARRPEVLILDEPTNNLDLRRQLDVLELLRQLTVERSITTIIALHDLNLAARYADRLVVLDAGRVYASGSPDEILTAELLHDIYGIQASIVRGADGVPVAVPLASLRTARPNRPIAPELAAVSRLVAAPPIR
ncbi:MAG TPA: ABC transporter ATP-binding protein [Thermomicrobiaceae bacterium]|nr:ABC transporter ATP-binding protein [Thermomicrobiaceae bacterium]